MTFRRRAARLRGIVVADVVAAFIISFVAAAEWEITPLYLEAKMKWGLSDSVSYLAYRCGLGIVALVVLLPLFRSKLLLRNPTLGLLGGVSGATASVVLGSLTPAGSGSVSVVPLLGLLRPYMSVAAESILVLIARDSELGSVLVCLGSVEQVGLLAGWIAFHYQFPVLLRRLMEGVSFLETGFLLLVPSVIFGALYFSLRLRQAFLSSQSPASSSTTTTTSSSSSTINPSL